MDSASGKCAKDNTVNTGERDPTREVEGTKLKGQSAVDPSVETAKKRDNCAISGDTYAIPFLPTRLRQVQRRAPGVASAPSSCANEEFHSHQRTPPLCLHSANNRILNSDLSHLKFLNYTRLGVGN
jgi:hypothetical protein